MCSKTHLDFNAQPEKKNDKRNEKKSKWNETKLNEANCTGKMFVQKHKNKKKKLNSHKHTESTSCMNEMNRRWVCILVFSLLFSHCRNDETFAISVLRSKSLARNTNLSLLSSSFLITFISKTKIFCGKHNSEPFENRSIVIKNRGKKSEKKINWNRKLTRTSKHIRHWRCFHFIAKQFPTIKIRCDRQAEQFSQSKKNWI